MSTLAFAMDQELGTPNSPAIRFTRGTVFAATLVRNCYGLSGCWPPVRIWPVSQPTGAFTSRLSTGRSPFPSLDITTTVSGLLCWRDSHPLGQLASLHWSGRAPAPPVRETGWSARTRSRSWGMISAGCAKVFQEKMSGAKTDGPRAREGSAPAWGGRRPGGDAPRPSRPLDPRL